MWYEVLPSIGVIFRAMCVGAAAMSIIPNMILGKPSMKRLLHPFEFEYYLRDMELTGCCLEGIPDADPTDQGTSNKK